MGCTGQIDSPLPPSIFRDSLLKKQAYPTAKGNGRGGDVVRGLVQLRCWQLIQGMHDARRMHGMVDRKGEVEEDAHRAERACTQDEEHEGVSHRCRDADAGDAEDASMGDRRWISTFHLPMHEMHLVLVGSKNSGPTLDTPSACVGPLGTSEVSPEFTFKGFYLASFLVVGMLASFRCGRRCLWACHTVRAETRSMGLRGTLKPI